MKAKSGLAVLLLLFNFSLCAQNSNPIIQFGTRMTIKSKVLNEEREVWISLPSNYDGKYFQAAQYPVLYILDGDLHFQSVASMVDILSAGTNGTLVIPEMIVVAIPNTDRTRDLTPTNSNKMGTGKISEHLRSSGGGGNFLRFLKNELIPKIDSAYRTFPYRTFVGHSFGGLNVMQALFEMPEVFNAYVAIDPSFWWDDQLFGKKSETYFNQAKLRGKSLFIAQANTLNSWDTVNVHFESIKKFVANLETRNKSGVRWQYQFYPNDHHGSVAFAAEHDALRFIFRNYFAPMTIKSASELVEHYREFSDETQVKFAPPERIVHQFGSFARFRGDYPLAKSYLELNIQNYPKSSSAFANMGELYLNSGDKKKALEFCEKAIAIFPGNEDAQKKCRTAKTRIRSGKISTSENQLTSTNVRLYFFISMNHTLMK